MLTCCPKCLFYDTCELKWYRGERGEPQLCCDRCEWFAQCRVKEIEEEIKELPAGCGDTRVALMVIDPCRIHAYWEITTQTWEKARDELKGEFDQTKKILRVYDVTYIVFDGANAHSYFDIYVGETINWYMDLWSPEKSLCAELGLITPQGKFCPLARSNFIHTPRDRPSEKREERWMNPLTHGHVSGDLYRGCPRMY